MRALKANVAQLLANTLYQECNKGASLNLGFDSPVDGYMVSYVGGLVFPNVTDVSTIDVARFIRENWNELDSDNVYMGVWKDNETGEVCFDISVNVANEDIARDVAETLKQIAIWDVARNKEIRL